MSKSAFYESIFRRMVARDQREFMPADDDRINAFYRYLLEDIEPKTDVIEIPETLRRFTGK